MVREFMEYRPYESIQEYRREIGKYVGDAQTAEWERYIYVPVDPNQSDRETLKQIPGVDDAIANALIAGRPYASTQAFLDGLAGQVNEDQAAPSVEGRLRKFLLVLALLTFVTTPIELFLLGETGAATDCAIRSICHRVDQRRRGTDQSTA